MPRKIIVYLFVGTLLKMPLVSGCAHINYRHCPDEMALHTQFNVLRNDLLQATFYCGSDDVWHYFVVERRLWFITIEDGLKAPAVIPLPFSIKPLSQERNTWVVIDGYTTWLDGLN